MSKKLQPPPEPRATVYFQEKAVQGVLDTVKPGGLMIFIDEPLEVSVAVAGTVLKGRLVRIQRMSATQTGIAIQLDER